jgi:competence CoiA-like predicted nuclease
MNQKDIIVNTLRLTSSKEVSVINTQDEDYYYSSIVSDGGAIFKKGLSIGFQDKMSPGLIIYDDENFYGYSDKFGLCLLSNHNEYEELSIPVSTFEEDNQSVNRLQPTPQNSSDNFKNMSETEKEIIKNLNIDIEVKDSNNFYIVIPKEYSNNKIIINFDITYIYNLDTIISNLSLVIINESTKMVFFKITNNNCFYEENFKNEISKRSIHKLNLEIINSNYFLITKKYFPL